MKRKTGDKLSRKDAAHAASCQTRKATKTTNRVHTVAKVEDEEAEEEADRQAGRQLLYATSLRVDYEV